MPTLTAAPAIGYVNRASGATVTTATAASGYPATNLANARMGSLWRSTADTSEEVDVDLGSSLDIDVMALLGTNLTDAADKTPVTSEASDYSSPEHNPGQSDVFDTTYTAKLDDEPVYGRHLIHLPGSTLNSRYVRLTLDDGANPDGYVQARVYWAGPIWQPPYGMDYASELEEEFVGSPGVERYLRTWEITLKGLSEAEAREWRSILRNKLRSGRYLIIPRPTLAATFINEALYATLAEAPRVRAMPTYPIRYSVVAKFREVED